MNAKTHSIRIHVAVADDEHGVDFHLLGVRDLGFDVVAAGVEDTARHLIFGPEFPDASTRGLRNRIVREWERRDDPPPYRVVPDSELSVIGQARLYGQEMPMKRFCGFPPTPEFTGDFEEMSLLAGESVGQTKRLMTAAGIIDEMISGAESVIRKRLGSMVVD